MRMNMIQKILMIDSITEEILELVRRTDNAKSEALRERLQKELDTKKDVLEGFKCSLADDIVECMLYPSDDLEEDCDEDTCECMIEKGVGNVDFLHRVAQVIGDAADRLEENGMVRVVVK